jgi:general secretion pathway protein D
VGVITRENWAEQLAQIASPSLIANLRASDGAVNLLSNPRIRVRNREKAKIQVGEKVPVFTTQFAATGFGTSNAIGASTTYIDVGLKVEVEPQIHHESEVSIKVALEVSNILEQVQGPAQTTAYRIGARMAQTNLRLRDAETQVLAGLISDNDRQFAQRVPGLGRMPVLGRLFSNERTETERTEIILMITPRIVRAVSGPLHGEAALIAGTESAAGVAPLTLSSRARTAVAPSGSGRTQTPGAEDTRPSALAAAGGALPASAAAIPSEPIARLAMTAPAQVRAGQDFTLSLTMDEGVLVGPAEVDLEWDPAAFSLPASVTMSGGGKAKVTLSGEGGPRTGQFRLRASPSGVTSGSVAVVAVRATAGDGRPADGVALPLPIAIGIAP